MAIWKRNGQPNEDDPEQLVELYEDGFKEIDAILADGDLTADEQLDAIAQLMFGDEGEED